MAGGLFDPISFVLKPTGQPFPTGGAITAMQVHYSESGGYPGAEEEEESSGSVPVVVDLLAPGSRKPRGLDGVPCGFCA